LCLDFAENLFFILCCSRSITSLAITIHAFSVSVFFKSCGKKSRKKSTYFLQRIKRMDIGGAFGVVKNEGTACTDYLRNKIGDILRNAIAPEVNNALNEYKLVKQWNDLVASAKLLLGDKLNLGKKREIRTKAQARNTVLLQKVFEQIVK